MQQYHDKCQTLKQEKSDIIENGKEEELRIKKENDEVRKETEKLSNDLAQTNNEIDATQVKIATKQAEIDSALLNLKSVEEEEIEVTKNSTSKIEILNSDISEVIMEQNVREEQLSKGKQVLLATSQENAQLKSDRNSIESKRSRIEDDLKNIRKVSDEHDKIILSLEKQLEAEKESNSNMNMKMRKGRKEKGN